MTYIDAFICSITRTSLCTFIGNAILGPNGFSKKSHKIARTKYGPTDPTIVTVPTIMRP
jgi:hypothetical protein